MCNEPYVRTTPPRPYRGVRRGTPTAATHVSTPTDHQATRAATPTLRGTYIRRDGTPRRGSSALDGRVGDASPDGFPHRKVSPTPTARHLVKPDRASIDGFPHGQLSVGADT